MERPELETEAIEKCVLVPLFPKQTHRNNNNDVTGVREELKSKAIETTSLLLVCWFVENTT